MMILRLLAILMLLCVSSAYADTGVAVVQSAAPTSNGGTQDFTSTGFGTPVCAMFFVSYGTVNGTVVNHALLSVGFSDFTNEQSMFHAAEDSAGTTNTGANTGTTALRTALNTDQSVDGTAVASTITDGVRLTWADAPPTAYLVTAVMFNSAVFSNCAVGSLTASTSLDGTASVTGLGWAPDGVMGMSRNNATSNARTSMGFAINDSGIVQYAVGENSQNGVATSDVASVMRNDRLVLNPVGTGGSSLELTSWDSGGFTVTTRDAGSTNVLLYLTYKLVPGINAKLLACTSPTSTGAHSCIGTGWTPQAGIMLHTLVPTLGTYYTSAADNESYGISAFTASGSSSSSIADDDGVASANTESMTDSKPVRLRKDGADIMTATLTGFQSDGADFSYTATDGTARYRAILFFRAASTNGTFGVLRRRGY